MTRTKASKKLTLRRFATFTAALGALVMSSGVALMVTAESASAAKTEVGICHATSSDTNPYVFILVDDDSAKFTAHLAHRNTPNKTWKDAGTFEGVAHAAGAAKPDFIHSYTDDHGVFHQMDGDITAASCDGDVVPPKEAVADVDFFDPTCANLGVPSYDTTGANVTFAITDGSVAPATHIVVTATADVGSEFSGGATTMNFPWDFGPAVDLNAPPCAAVNPPGIVSASVAFTNPSCGNDNTASYKTNGENVTFAVTSGSASAGEHIEVTATADADFEFADHTTEKVFSHDYSDAVDTCSSTVEPPVIVPTVVGSGLVAPDLRSEQGLALLVTGMVLMIIAGGLGLTRPARKARI
jgi:hypothetical protein